MYYLKRILESKPKIDFEHTTRENIEELLDKFDTINAAKFKKLDASKKEHSSIKHDFKKFKFFYKQMFGDGFYYPKVVGWLKLDKPSDQKIMPTGILSEAKILKMIRKATYSRDEALIALDFDSGIRAGELINMKKRDIEHIVSAVKRLQSNGKIERRFGSMDRLYKRFEYDLDKFVECYNNMPYLSLDTTPNIAYLEKMSRRMVETTTNKRRNDEN